ncbi:hypothetical protein GCM10009609_39890 [Pseudonocardia aurantiaca]|uniref:Transcriptional regulator n=1 Tax=Pseudonocardia aurantiaca TaxID=75290 RepID=A0ABW4FP59_9PSEU
MALRLSVRAFAEHLGVAVRTVSKWSPAPSAPCRGRTPKRFSTLPSAVLTVRRRSGSRCSAGQVGITTGQHPRFCGPSPLRRPAAAGTADHIPELLVHLREQWHALVRTDNLLGPRFALAGVLDQLAIIQELLRMTTRTHRAELVTLAGTYAESAAWLYEDAGQMPSAALWVGRAMEWAHEASDDRLLAI